MSSQILELSEAFERDVCYSWDGKKISKKIRGKYPTRRWEMGCPQEDCSMNVTSKQRPKGCIQINQVNKWYKTALFGREKDCSWQKSEPIIRDRAKGSLNTYRLDDGVHTRVGEWLRQHEGLRRDEAI